MNLRALGQSFRDAPAPVEHAEAAPQPDTVPRHEPGLEQGPAAISDALQELPADQQRVLALRLFEGRSNAEIARTLGRSVEAIRALQYRALRHLWKRAGPP